MWIVTILVMIRMKYRAIFLLENKQKIFQSVDYSSCDKKFKA